MASESDSGEFDGGLFPYLTFAASILSAVTAVYVFGWIYLRYFCYSAGATWYLNKLATSDFLLAGAPIGVAFTLPLILFVVSQLAKKYLEEPPKSPLLEVLAVQELQAEPRALRADSTVYEIRTVQNLQRTAWAHKPVIGNPVWEIVQTFRSFFFRQFAQAPVDNPNNPKGQNTPKQPAMIFETPVAKIMAPISRYFEKIFSEVIKDVSQVLKVVNDGLRRDISQTFGQLFDELTQDKAWFTFFTFAPMLIPLVGLISADLSYRLSFVWIALVPLFPAAWVLRLAKKPKNLDKFFLYGFLFNAFLSLPFAISCNGYFAGQLPPAYEVRLTNDEEKKDHPLILSGYDSILLRHPEFENTALSVSDSDIEWVKRIVRP